MSEKVDIDKDLVRKRFARAMHSYEKHAVVQTEMAERLLKILRHHAGTSFDTILEIGCGSGVLSRLIIENLDYDRVYLNDLSQDFAPLLPFKDQVTFHAGDAETLYFPPEQALIISNAAIQWIRDLDTFMEKVSSLLRPGGWFAFSCFGQENLLEIQNLTGKGLEYPDISFFQSLPDFNIALAEQEKRQLVFSSPRDVLKHLKYTGVNSLGKEGWSKGSMREFEESYRSRFSTGQGVTLTYNPLYILGRKKVQT